ncbi:hypothetical protein ACW2Q0_29220 [Nocardia sp. R16R-3T]
MANGPQVPTWRNEVTLSSIDKFQSYAPEAFLRRVSPTPLLMVIAEQDTLTPADIALQSYAEAVDVGGPKKINAQQGSVPYGVDEFRTGSKALQAIVDYDAKHGTRLAQDLISGESDFDYLLMHTEPGTNKITVTQFEPGEGQGFNLAHPGTGQKPSTLPEPTRSVGDGGNPPEPSVSVPAAASPTAAEAPPSTIIPSTPKWATGVIAAAAPWLAGIAAQAQPRITRVAGPLPSSQFLSKPTSSVNQSLTVNIATQPSLGLSQSDGENARVMAYAASIR